MTTLIPPSLPVPSLQPILVISKMSPFVNRLTKDGTMAHRQVVYAVSRDEALVEVLEEMLSIHW